MKKITTIAAAMLLGSFGFTAMAQLPEATVTPSGGSMSQLPDYVVINWGEETLKLNPEAEGYQSFMGNNIYALTVKVNEQEQTVTSYVATEDGGWYNNAETGPVFVFSLMELGISEDATIEFTLPAGVVLIGNDEEQNTVVGPVTYNYVYIADEPTPEPAKLSELFSISEFTLSWQGAKLAENSNYDGDGIVFGEYDYLEGKINNPTPVKQVQYNEDGTATVDLGVNYSTAGPLRIEIPADYFTLQTSAGNFTGPTSESGILYNIKGQYVVSPASYQTVGGPFSSFSISAQKSIKVVGYLENIIVADDKENTYAVASTKDITDAEYPGLEFILEKPYYGNGLKVTIPSGTLEIDGEVYEEEITWEFFVKSPVVTPANNSAIASLSNVSLEWENATINANEGGYEGNPTLLIGSESVNISQYVSVKEEEITVNNPDLGEQIEYVKSLVVDFSESPYTTAGAYTITIPANYVEIVDDNGNSYNNEIVLNYVVSGGTLANPTITPEDKSVLYGWPVNAVLSWDEEITAVGELYVYLTYDGTTQSIPARIQDSGASVNDEWVPEPPYQLIIDWADYTSDPVTYLTNAGEYTITVPAGLVKNSDYEVNEEIVLTYTLYGTKTEEVITPDPNAVDEENDGTRIAYSASELSAVKVEFESDLTAVANPPVITLTQIGGPSDEESGVMPLSLENGIVDNAKVEGNCIVLDLSDLTSGEWLINIPAGYAQINESTYTGEIKFIYLVENGIGLPTLIGIENGKTYAPEDVPATATITWNYQDIDLTGEGVVTIEYFNTDNKLQTVNVAATDVVLTYVAAPTGSDSNVGVDPLAETYNAVEIKLASYLEGVDGFVAINIPDGLVSNGSKENEAYTIDINIDNSSAINAIESANGAVEGVYNLQGVKVGNSLDNLRPGIYVINGKKVLVRK